MWFAGNENLAFFHIDRHRSAEVAKTIFGEDFSGTLVRDRYAAYNGIGGDWQVCLAHILTNAKEISAEHALLPQTEKDPATGPFCDRLRDLCARLCEVGQKLESGHIPWKAAATIAPRSERKRRANAHIPPNVASRSSRCGWSCSQQTGSSCWTSQ